MKSCKVKLISLFVGLLAAYEALVCVIREKWEEMGTLGMKWLEMGMEMGTLYFSTNPTAVPTEKPVVTNPKMVLIEPGGEAANRRRRPVPWFCGRLPADPTSRG